MKQFLVLLLMASISFTANGACVNPISRTNNSANTTLTSTKYNLDLNTVYSKVNNLAGDCITDETISTSKIANEAITAEKIASAVLAKVTPVGSILAFGGTIAPEGYLLCNGQTVSRTTYAELFAIIGTSFGNGNGSTTFHLPDFRGRFLRGVDGGTGRDPDASSRSVMNAGGNAGDLVGSVQLDDFKSHTHTIGYNNLGEYSNTTPRPAPSGVSATYPTGATGGNETRPVNANVNFIMKY